MCVSLEQISQLHNLKLGSGNWRARLGALHIGHGREEVSVTNGEHKENDTQNKARYLKHPQELNRNSWAQSSLKGKGHTFANLHLSVSLSWLF